MRTKNIEFVKKFKKGWSRARVVKSLKNIQEQKKGIRYVHEKININFRNRKNKKKNKYVALIASFGGKRVIHVLHHKMACFVKRVKQIVCQMSFGAKKKQIEDSDKRLYLKSKTFC